MGNRLGRKFVTALSDVLRQFAPFHTVAKLFVGKSFTDYYDASGYMHTTIDVCLDDAGENFQNSYSTSAFPGTRGTGVFSGIASDIFQPTQGRFLPSATLGGDGYFWSSSSSTNKENPAAPRTSARRRNYKYIFPCSPFDRGGKAQPISLDFMSASGVNPIYNQLDPDYIPKGFAFSSNTFYSTSGSLSGVYLYELNDNFTYDGFYPSSFFPSRAVPPFTDPDDFDITSASSLPVFRDFFGSNIRRTITGIKVEKGNKDRRWWNFAEPNLVNFKFGQGLHALFKDYTVKYFRKLNEYVNYKRKYEGGRNVIAHAFGPLVYNHDFSWSGSIQEDGSKYAFENQNQKVVSTDYPEWSAIAAPAAAEGETYASQEKTTLTLTQGLLSRGAYGTYTHSFDILESPSRSTFTNDTVLSGIQLVSTNGRNFAVWNQKNSYWNIDFRGSDGVTLVKRDVDKNPLNGVRLRFPLDGNLNRLINGDLKFSPLDINKEDKSLSAFAAWGLADKNRTPGINKFATAHSSIGTVVPIKLDNLTPSSVRAAQFAFSGAYTGSGIGSTLNPSLYTVASPSVKTYPRNPDNVTLFKDHILSLQASASTGNWSPYLAIYNASRDEVWDNSTSSWTNASGLDTSAWPLTQLSVSGEAVAAGKFQYWTHRFNLSANVGTSDYLHDQLQFWVHPVGSTAAQSTVNIKKLKLLPEHSHNNTLFPEKVYSGTLQARVAKTSPNLRDQVAAMRVFTHFRPLVGYGLGDSQKSFCYNFRTKMWEETDAQNLDQWKLLPLNKAVGSQTVDFQFHTWNSRTPLRYNSTSQSDYFTSAGKIHAQDTGYYIEVAKPFYGGDNQAVTIEKLSLVDTEYAQAVDCYDEADVKSIFEFFDDISNSDHSRHAFDSSGTFFVSGGSRSEYLEFYGGSHSAVDGIYVFEENEG